ncbi:MULTISPECIES: hypothetical protein [Okeania]|nr:MULTISPECIES: hypothetical protein [Okeania]NET74937.1 hypothetical protein [Okeania sp. SIO1F9]
MKKEKGRRKKWMATQTTTNCQHSVDGGIINPKEKDKPSKVIRELFVREK